MLSPMPFMLAGLLFAGLGVPLWMRRVPPNPFYGFRVPKTLRNPEVWYPANEYTGRLMVYTGLAVMAAALAFSEVRGLSEDTYAAICAAVLVAGALWMTVAGFLFLRRFP